MSLFTMEGCSVSTMKRCMRVSCNNSVQYKKKNRMMGDRRSCRGWCRGPVLSSPTLQLCKTSGPLAIGGGMHRIPFTSLQVDRTRHSRLKALPLCFQSVVAAFQANPIGMMTSVATLLGSCALVALLVAAIPALFALRRTLVAAEVLLVSLQDELPDAVAAFRLSGLELSDALEEVSGLGSDVTAGLRATARALVGAEGGVRGSVEALQAMTPAMHQAAEKALQKRASLVTRPRGLGDSLEEMRKGMRRTTGVSKAARLALNAARLIDSTTASM
jgi:hypothetical protein